MAIQKTVRLVAVAAGAGAIFALGASTGSQITVAPTVSPQNPSDVLISGLPRVSVGQVGEVTLRPKRASTVSVEVDTLGGLSINYDAGAL